MPDSSDFRASLEVEATSDLRDLDRVESGIEDMADSLRDLGDATGDATSEAEDAEGSFLGLGDSLVLAAGAAAVFVGAMAVGDVISAGVGAVLEFDTAMNKVAAQTGLTGAALDDFEEQATDVFNANWGENMTDVADTMATVANITGASGDELERLTTQALIMRDVFDKDITESMRAADVMSKQFGIDAGLAMDILTVGIQATGDPADDLLDTFNEYSGNFAQMGFSAEQTLDLLAQGMAAGARNTDDVADAFREFQIRLTDGSAEDAIDSLGSGAATAFDRFQDGEITAANAFESIIQGLQDIEDPIARNAAGVEIFGTKWEDMGEDVFLALDPTSVIIDEFHNMEGATQRAGDAMSQGLGPAIEGLKRQALTLLREALTPFVELLVEEGVPIIEDMAEAMADMADDAAPALEDIAEASEDAFDAMEPLFELVEDGAKAFADMLVEGGPVVDFLKFFAIALAGLTAVLLIYSIATGAAAVVTSGLVAALGVLLSPIVLIAAAIALIGVAYKTNFLGFGDAVNSVAATIWSVMKPAVEWLAGFLSGAFNASVAAAKVLWEGFKNLMVGLWELVRPGLEAVSGWLETTFAAAKDIAVTAWNLFKDLLAGAWTAISPALTDIAAWFETVFGLAVDMAKIALNTFITALQFAWTLYIKPALTKITDWFSTTFGLAVENAKAVWEGFKNLMVGIWELVRPGLEAVSGWLDTTLGLAVTIASAAWDTFTNKLTAVAAAVTIFVSDLVLAISGAATSAYDAAKALGDKIAEGIGDGLDGLKDIIQTTIDNINDWLPNDITFDIPKIKVLDEEKFLGETIVPKLEIGGGEFKLDFPDNPIPGLALGGNLGLDELSLVNERGLEGLVDTAGNFRLLRATQSGQRVIPAERSRSNGAGGNGKIPVTNYIQVTIPDGRVLFEFIKQTEMEMA